MMARVVVTGGAGKLGRACVDELLRHGWDVVVFDRVRPPPENEAVFVPVDLTDYGQVLDAMLGVEERYVRPDAMVHLAAVPAPGVVPDHLTFINNMGCTWNVLSAARRAGVTNIVWASSETVLGLPFDAPPPYIPVDEEYPPRPESTYSLVKTLEEAMAVQLCRWNPELKMIGLRFSNVMEPADYARFSSFDDDPGSRKWNLWGYVDARDGAQAVRLVLDSDLTGTEVFIIANADTVVSRPNAALIGVLSRRRGPRRPRRARHAALDREGQTAARLPTCVRLARRRYVLGPIKSTTRYGSSGTSATAAPETPVAHGQLMQPARALSGAVNGQLGASVMHVGPARRHTSGESYPEPVARPRTCATALNSLADRNAREPRSLWIDLDDPPPRLAPVAGREP
jgi:nucleoside-diphosphate-sugar epimerase